MVLLPVQAYSDNKESIKQQYNLFSLRRLFEVVDVLGISHYAPMPLQMTFASFEVRLPFTHPGRTDCRCTAYV